MLFDRIIVHVHRIRCVTSHLMDVNAYMCDIIEAYHDSRAHMCNEMCCPGSYSWRHFCMDSSDSSLFGHRFHLQSSDSICKFVLEFLNSLSIVELFN